MRTQEYSLPFEGMPNPQMEGQGAEGSFWEGVAATLEQIEKNTRSAGRASPLSAGGAPLPLKDASPRLRPRAGSVSPLPAVSSTLPTARAARAERATPQAEAAQRGAPASRAGNGKASATASVKPAEAASPTKSQQALERKRQEGDVRAQSKGLMDALKSNLSQWDGSVSSPDKESLQDAAGLAAGGPLWSAIKEVKDVISSGDDDEKSLAGILKKTLADKTGVTAAKERVDKAKEAVRNKALAWAGAKPEEGSAPVQGGRDSKGRFVKADLQAVSPEVKLAEESYALASQEAVADDKRHDELLEAVKGSKGGGKGGVFGEGGLIDAMRNRGDQGGRSGGADVGRRGRAGTPGRARGWRGALAKGGSVLAGGAAMLTGGVSDMVLDAGASLLSSSGTGKVAASTVASTASGAGGVAGKAAGLGGKAMAGAAKAIPVAGQLLAAGMAAYDGVQGWSDKEMQQRAFGLAEGQEASTGQKASTAAANVLDMGGLFTGAASLLGFDVSTADMAKGIYGMGDTVGSSLSGAWGGVTGLFSGSDKSAEKAVGTPAPAPVTSASEAITKTEDKGFFDGLVTALSELTGKIDEEIKKKESESSLFPTVGGFFSGVSSWIGSKVSGGGQAAGGSRGGGRRGGKTESTATYSGLGDVVNIGETGGKGTAMISKGTGDHGGVSYGRSQLASKVGSIDAAMKWAKANGYEDIHNELAPLSGDATSRNGQFAQKWGQMAQEKGGRLEQFDKAYQKQGYFDPMMAKIRKENPELAKRIEANPALQEQVLSTAVQYGQNSGRYISAADEVLNRTPDATDKDLLSGIQDIKARDAGRNFKSSSGAVQNSIAKRHGVDEKQRLLAVQDRFEKGEIAIDPASGTAKTKANSAFAAAPKDAVDAASRSLQVSTQEAMDRGVKYKFGGKNSSSGGIDCSGWVTEINRSMMESVNAQAGKDVYSKEAKAVLAKGANGGAAGIIQSVSQATGELLKNEDLAPENIREGMMIGMDTGSKGWDAGRFGGIDHITQTYRDEKTGRMMVSESTSGKGVTSTDYEEWYKKWNGKAKLYGADATKLADASLAKEQNASPQLAEAAAPANAQAPESKAVAATPAQTAPAAPQSAAQVAAQQQAQPQPQRYPDPEPMRPLAESAGSKVDVSSQMVALLTQLLDVTGSRRRSRTRTPKRPTPPTSPWNTTTRIA